MPDPAHRVVIWTALVLISHHVLAAPHPPKATLLGAKVATTPNDPHYVSFLMEDARRLLQTKFGLESFRDHQEAIISRIIVDGQSALGILPTGSGKSLCYQLPALMLKLVLVVSPLKSLMKDQVDILNAMGIKAGQINSSQTEEEYKLVVEMLTAGELRILYVAPERLSMEGFKRLIQRLNIDLLVVDEAHTIAEWGNRFRPAYLKITAFIEEFAITRVLCTTATATETVANGICEAFRIDVDHGVFRASIYRPNLHLSVEVTNDLGPSIETRLRLVKEYCSRETGTIVIYVRTRKNAEMTANFLQRSGFFARAYHADMSQAVRDAVQEDFKTKANMIVCATIAFGMGIHKADVRHIIHLNPPKSLEGYAQEIGRAGRDGKPSSCVLYLAPGEKEVYENLTLSGTASRWSVRSLLWQFCQDAQEQGVQVGGVVDIDVRHYANQFDLRGDTVHQIFAKLELDFPYVRVLTPECMEYEYAARLGTGNLPPQIVADASPAARMIRAEGKAKRIWFNICVTDVSKETGIKRSDLIAKLREWHNAGFLTGLKGHEERHRYRILEELLTDQDKIYDIADQIYDALEQTAQEDVTRLDQLFDWARTDECLSKGLNRHFGDTESLPGDDVCGNCSVCENGGPIRMPDSIQTQFRLVDMTPFRNILAATRRRHDAKFLTRIAVGCTSPLIKREQLDKPDIFGKLSHLRWTDLVQRFQDVIDQGPTEPPVYIPRLTESKSKPKTPTKRKSSGDSDSGEASGSTAVASGSTAAATSGTTAVASGSKAGHRPSKKAKMDATEGQKKFMMDWFSVKKNGQGSKGK